MCGLPLDRSPTDEELAETLRVYVRIHSTTEAEDEAHAIAFDDICNLVRDRPDDARRFLQIACAADLTLENMAFIAAGPLEELLSHHGDAVIDWVEAEARRSPRFRILVAGVWRLFMSDAVWARVLALRQELSIPPL